MSGRKTIHIILFMSILIYAHPVNSCTLYGNVQVPGEVPFDDSTSIGTTPIDTIKQSIDSLQIKNWLNQNVSGKIVFESGYGMLPVYYNSTGYDWHNRVFLELNYGYTIPVKLIVDYRNPQYTGLRAPVSLSFDSQKFQQNYRKSINTDIGELNTVKQGLSNQKSQAIKEMAYYEKKAAFFRNNPSLPNVNSVNMLPDSLSNVTENLNVDTLNQIDSLNIDLNANQLNAISGNLEINPDNINNAGDEYNGVIDSADYYQAKAQSVKDKTDSLSTAITEIEKSISRLNELPTSGVAVGGSKITSYLTYVRKFEVGNFAPDYSGFLINGTQIRGINLEFNHNFYMAGTHGTCIDPLYTSHSTYSHSNSNYFDRFVELFDFEPNSYGRKISMVKLGLGTRENSHFHIGLLSGKGMPGTINTTSATLNQFNGTHKNLVVELDTRFKLGTHKAIEVRVAKSQTHSVSVSKSESKSDLNTFLKEDLSAAYQFGFNTDVPLLKSRFDVKIKYVEPYFKSFGISYLRTDMYQFDFKSNHQLSKKIRITVRYRNEENNLHNIYSYTTRIDNASIQVNCKINRRFTASLIENPVFISVSERDGETRMNNYVLTCLNLVYLPKSGKTQHVLSSTLSHYYSQNDFSKGNVINLCITDNFSIGKNLSCTGQISYFSSELNSMIEEQSVLSGVSATKSLKKSTVNAGVTGIYSKKYDLDYGVQLGTSYSIKKNITAGLNFEKIAMQGMGYQDQLTGPSTRVPYMLSLKVSAKL